MHFGFSLLRKEAVTDGLKRALKCFGSALGNCLNDKDYVRLIGARPKTQPKYELSEVLNEMQDASTSEAREQARRRCSSISNVAGAGSSSSTLGPPKENVQPTTELRKSFSTSTPHLDRGGALKGRIVDASGIRYIA